MMTLQAGGATENPSPSGRTFVVVISPFDLSGELGLTVLWRSDVQRVMVTTVQAAIEVARVRQRDLIDRGVATLRKSPGRLAATVRALGQPLGAPWGADQKSAATLAWLLLAAGQAGTPPRSR